MQRSDGNRARLGGVLLTAALGAVALLALPGIALTHDKADRPAAGTIESFDTETGELVVDLAKGDTISGLVVRRTHIRCGDKGRHHGHHLKRRRGGKSASASRRGPDDAAHGVRDSVPGEDRPGDDGTAPGRSENPGQGAERSDRCNVEDLVPGAIVKRAEIVLTHGNAFYKKIGVIAPVTPAS
jgi:hypothetical protein